LVPPFPKDERSETSESLSATKPEKYPGGLGTAHLETFHCCIIVLLGGILYEGISAVSVKKVVKNYEIRI
jgi:hypothetical protein